MGRKFNVTADCKQNLHYMIDLDSRLAQIKEYVDEGKYFTINRARQYGKTTTLRALKEYKLQLLPVLLSRFIYGANRCDCGLSWRTDDN